MRKSIYSIALAFVSLMFVPTTAYAATSSPEIVAHRGVTNTGYTEESVNAEVLAAQMGADYIDLDIQVSSNGVLYAMHDDTLDRTTTDGTGPLSDYTSTEINAMHLNDGSRIPHLSDILNAVQSYPVKASLEIKKPRADTYDRIKTNTLAFGASRVVVHSFVPAHLSAYRAIAPQQTMGIDSPTQVTAATLNSMDLDVAIIKQTATSATYANSLHAAGKSLWVWTTNGVSGWSTYSPYVDAMITDQFPAYQEWLAAQPT